MSVQRWTPHESVPARQDTSDLISAEFPRKTRFRRLVPVQPPQAGALPTVVSGTIRVRSRPEGQLAAALPVERSLPRQFTTLASRDVSKVIFSNSSDNRNQMLTEFECAEDEPFRSVRTKVSDAPFH